jgi:hypothetical protein
MEFDRKTLPRRTVDDAPDGEAAIAVLGTRSDRIAGLEREILLYIVDGREIVVFDLAKLQEAVRTVSETVSMSLSNFKRQHP